MLIQTKHFGEVTLDQDKIITFKNGLMGFEEYKQYTILFDTEEEDKSHVSWLQSVEEPGLALPVVSPFVVIPDYAPVVEDELLAELGELNDENLVVLLVMTVPKDISQVSVNLKAPIIINADSKTGSQTIVENKEYEVKHNVYKDIQKLKQDKGGE